MIAKVLASMVGSAAFSVLFQVPTKYVFRCGLVGGAGYLVYLSMSYWGASLALSCFGATVILTLLARFCGVWHRTPVTVFLLSGIFPLVPGAGIYYTAYYLFSGNGSMAASKGMDTLMFAGTISLGILFGSSPPQWLFVKLLKWEKSKEKN